MAETYQSGPNPTEEQDPAAEPRQPGFHYYSGGEVKELEHTRVSPALWALWTVVILGAVGYLFLGGALGPHGPFGGFKPMSSSADKMKGIQQTLNQQANGGATAQQADMTQLKPFLDQYAGGESLSQAVSNGSNVYQNYCNGCHGPNQDGNGPNASSLNPKPRNLHDAPFMRETLNYQRINTSLHYGVHGTAMPRWENTLSEREIQEVISYVLSLTWTMPPSSDMDTTTAQLATPPATPKGRTSPAVNAGLAAPGKSVSGSTTGTAGGGTVQGGDAGGAGSVSNSPEPITPEVEGNPAASTSTAPPSQSGQPAAVPKGLNSNTPTDTNGGPQAPPSAAPEQVPGGTAPGR